MKWRSLSLVLMLFLPLALHAQLLVDCSGQNQNVYTTINAALADGGSGSTIVVNGTCNESVTLESVDGVFLGAWWGQTASVTGGIVISNSKNIYLYGLSVTNSAPADAIVAVRSTNVTLDTCSGNGSGQVGLASRYHSEVTIVGTGSFNNNAASGMYLDGGSSIFITGWGGPVDISNNGNNGVQVQGADFSTWGNTSITGSGGGGWGIYTVGGARLQVGTIFGSNTIQGNPSGGASITEHTEASFWNINGLQTIIQGNGPVGVAVGLGSQVTFFDGDQITDHTSAGVDVYGNSQVNFSGANSLLRNGTASDPRSAGIRVDGNSEALLRGGTISQNYGPGILALVNSSVDFTGLVFSGNTGGVISCDSTATMISDVGRPDQPLRPGVNCKTPHALGNRHSTRFSFKLPDLTPYKALQAKYRKIATKH